MFPACLAIPLLARSRSLGVPPSRLWLLDATAEDPGPGFVGWRTRVEGCRGPIPAGWTAACPEGAPAAAMETLRGLSPAGAAAG
mmetsp:Transcript_36177/g.71174  ORF Transcript_36177/g.71174 Transcript_36177/m.71174 type:complete len:84 (-) Transcript_36177:829-1080(-)